MDAERKPYHLDVIIKTAELSFDDVPGLVMTEVLVQNGENPQLHPKLVRVWTHGTVEFANNLNDLGMKDMQTTLKDRATRSYVHERVGFADILRHEVSPDVRVQTVPHDSQRHMMDNLKLALAEPLGRSSNGREYIARLDIVVVSQNSRAFLALGDLLRLSQDITLEKNTFVELYFLCAGETMAADTAAELIHWSAGLQSDGQADRYVWHCLTPSEHTILGVVSHVLSSPTRTMFFQSCSTARENLTLAFVDSEAATWFRFHPGSKVSPLRQPKRGSLLLCEDFVPFVPVRLLRIATIEAPCDADSFSLSFDDFEGTKHRVPSASVSSVVRQEFRHLQDHKDFSLLAVATLQFVSRTLLPKQSEYVQVLAPAVLLKKQIGMLKSDAPVVVREALESALRALACAKESLFPSSRRERACAALRACSAVLSKTRVDVAHAIGQLNAYVNEDFDAGNFPFPPTFVSLYPFLRMFDPDAKAQKAAGRFLDTGAPSRNCSVGTDFAAV